MTEEVVVKKANADRNMTGLAGELFVAAELLKRGLQTSITFGNAKQIDLFAHNPRTGHSFTIQVKSLRFKNCFPIRDINEQHTYVFVILNEPGKAVQYFIASGKHLLSDPVKYAYLDPKGFSAMAPKSLIELANKWEVFECEP
jgi:hypothetical protein